MDIETIMNQPVTETYVGLIAEGDDLDTFRELADEDVLIVRESPCHLSPGMVTLYATEEDAAEAKRLHRLCTV